MGHGGDGGCGGHRRMDGRKGDHTPPPPLQLAKVENLVDVKAYGIMGGVMGRWGGGVTTPSPGVG